ncbi:sensor domain-containing diguanylate cyclase [Achromobacter sp. Marseille-Q4962]|uniref:GGDEF domain-containing protein n=1 Tax=Achromobacter sp. Marseille-Q4962 TaxID=2942202 RepID=UPI002073A583|nr:sensor domain-containing diguanylate cyclase [Achromobacter sp. Marseille-Q4962]
MIRLDLRRLVLGICLLSVILALAGSLHASYLVQRDLLLHNALEVNRVYAAKLAATTETFLNDLRRYLGYSADQLADMESHPERMAAETRRLQEQLAHFNSSFVVSAGGKVLAVSSATPQMLGQHLTSEANRRALQSREPTISEPYLAASGRWLILYTHPIFSRDYRYLGYIAGTLYLHEDNALERLLGRHFYRDDSYLYVIDRHGTLLYHPDPTLLGKPAQEDPLSAAARAHEDGDLRYVNSEGRDMLAGYARVASTGWTVISQRPVRGTLQPLSDLLLATARYTLPLLVVSLALIWLLSRWIVRPLGQLADIARHMQDPDAEQRIRGVRSWYVEAAQLRRGLLVGLAAMHHKLRDLRRESTTDKLTGVLNRRGLDEAMALLQAEESPVSIVILDVDHFKRINDHYGHSAGDRALQRLAALMAEGSRIGDTLARTGGEEFAMLLPGASLTAAAAIAERLRERLAGLAAPQDIPVAFTVSVGVAHYPTHGATLAETLDRADQALYYAKRHGRDAVCVADDQSEGRVRKMA